MEIEIYYRRKASTMKRVKVNTDIDISYYDLMFDNIKTFFGDRNLIVEMIIPNYHTFEKTSKIFVSKELELVDFKSEVPIKEFLYRKGIRIAIRNERFSHVLGGVKCI